MSEGKKGAPKRSSSAKRKARYAAAPARARASAERRRKNNILRLEKKLKKLLKKGVEGKPGGILKNGVRHNRILAHIVELRKAPLNGKGT